MFVRLHQINRLLWSVINRDRGMGCRSGWTATWGLSALVHAFVLGLLALITLTNARPPDFIAVLADFPVPESVVKIDLPTQLPQIEETRQGPSAGGRFGAEGPVAGGIETAPEQAARRVGAPSSAGRPLSPVDFGPRLPPTDELAVFSLGTKLERVYAGWARRRRRDTRRERPRSSNWRPPERIRLCDRRFRQHDRETRKPARSSIGQKSIWVDWRTAGEMEFYM